MSKIKISALGGVGENGKNMYIVEVDERIFVLDAGLIYPKIDLYGIDAVIPNIDYLIENKNRVEGVFISHGHEDNIGALPYLLKNMNVKVFGTHFTISLIEELLTFNNMNISDYRLFKINDFKVLRFGKISVSFFNVNHSLPECVGIIISTEDGEIVYATDFNFMSSFNQKYKISYNKLLELSKKPVLAVLAESVGIYDTIRANNDFVLDSEMSNIIFRSKGNIFMVCYSTDLSRIQKVVDIAIKENKKIAIIGRKGEQIVHIAMKTNYLEIPSDNIIELNGQEIENALILIVGTANEPYNILKRIILGNDKRVKASHEDTIITLSDPISGCEKNVLNVLDIAARNDFVIKNISKKNIRTSHATQDDLSQLYSMINPKYFIPVKGEERHIDRHQKLLHSLNYPKENIFNLYDGNVIVFEKGEFVGNETIKTGELYVDGTLTGSVNEEIVEQRNTLANDGLIQILANIDTKKNSILNINVSTKGFVNAKFGDSGVDVINEGVMKVLKASFSKKRSISDIELTIKNEIQRVVYRLTRKSPAVLVIVVDLKNIKH